jgi:hypothetical protein
VEVCPAADSAAVEAAASRISRFFSAFERLEIFLLSASAHFLFRHLFKSDAP